MCHMCLLASRSGSSGTNNLPPLLFHQVHGDNIRLSGDNSVARRVESFCRGVAFSSRPVKVNEKVFIKFLEVSNNWSGVIRFGFTSNDPSNLRYCLPKYACPDLTSKPGYWAKALAERFAERDTVLYYYVTAMGDVYFGINGEEKGIFLSGVETRGPVWALFDVYGNSTGIELVDQRGSPMNNSIRRNFSNGSGDVSPDVDSQLMPSLQSLSIQNANQRIIGLGLGGVGLGGGLDVHGNSSALTRYHQTGTELTPFPFHRTRGRNVRLSNDRCLATRTDTEFCLGYVFTSKPIMLGEKIVIQILATEPMYAGALAFGLTSCDPAKLQISDLPEDSNALLDRPEYWVVHKDVANSPQRGDELAFSVLSTGEVQFSKNGEEPVVFMHVDQTLQLWAFFDIYGTTQKIRILGSIPTTCSTTISSNPSWQRMVDPSNRRSRVSSIYSGESSQLTTTTTTTPTPTPTSGTGQNSSVHQKNNQTNGVAHRHCCLPGSNSSTPAEIVQFQPPVGGGTVLVVNLPPAHSNFINHQQQQQQRSPSRPSSSLAAFGSNHHNTHELHKSHSNGFNRLPTVSSGTLVSNYTNTYIDPISSSSSYQSTIDTTSQWSDNESGTAGITNSECSICYERSIDSVLYMCGHMCMCYECAVQQWRGKGGGHCPLCRATIRDVIRTYKS
ncbi:neuralized, putative [Pediculus humanus corporis]|uniref:Protein neuralized n=1 Tax=Pediculus humanus subsp. corporis TaxID=121224 RepID=E0VYK7_PEDHC|nr:neuralized, putative [Pediculus humanus corporis]EEB18463.1 neuralized, putative [Pediculus humanus corporis]